MSEKMSRGRNAGHPAPPALGIEMRRAQPIGREFPTRTLSVCAAGS